MIQTGVETHSFLNLLIMMTNMLMMHTTQDCLVIQFEVLNNAMRLLCLFGTTTVLEKNPNNLSIKYKNQVRIKVFLPA